jgi:hypothetical protein
VFKIQRAGVHGIIFANLKLFFKFAYIFHKKCAGFVLFLGLRAPFPIWLEWFKQIRPSD